MSYEDDVKELERLLRFSYDYVEADFVAIRISSEGSLFSYKELLEMEIDNLKNRANRANRNAVAK